MSKYKTFLLSLILYGCLAIVMPSTILADVVITEILPNPDTPGDITEWMEIYNNSDSSIDLLDWSIGGKLIEILDFVLPPKGYAVITKDKEEFVKQYGPTKLLAELNVGLTNSGKEISIKDPFGRITDSITYQSSTTNQVWQRSGPDCREFLSSPKFSPGTVGEIIDLACYLPDSVFPVVFSIDNEIWSETITARPNQNIRVNFDASGIDFDSYYFTDISDRKIEEPFSWETYKGFLYLHLLNGEDVSIYRTNIIQVFPNIMINEVLVDVAGDDVGEEWIELKSADEIDLSMLEVIINDEEVEMKLEQKDQYYIVRLAGDKEYLLNCSQPSNCKNTLVLKYNGFELESLVIVDSIAGLTNSRDEDNKWHIGWELTPASENMPYQAYKKIQLSEIMSAPLAGDKEWVELYNHGNRTINLSGWHLRDNSSTHEINDLTIEPHTHKLINKLEITLNNVGEVISLYDKAGILVDEIEFSDSDKGSSLGRKFLKGLYGGSFVATKLPTPGAINEFEEAGLAQSPVKVLPVSTTQLPVESSQKPLVENLYSLPQNFSDNSLPVSMERKDVLFSIDKGMVPKIGITSVLSILSIWDLSLIVRPYLYRYLRWWLKLS